MDGIDGRPGHLVAGGVVYVGAGDGKLYAFDAAGSNGCAGSPAVCVPLWTGATGIGVFSSPAVAGDLPLPLPAIIVWATS